MNHPPHRIPIRTLWHVSLRARENLVYLYQAVNTFLLVTISNQLQWDCFLNPALRRASLLDLISFGEFQIMANKPAREPIGKTG